KYFLQFGVTLSLAVALSYVEAVTLAPSRCAQLLKTSRDGRTRLGRAVDAGFARLARGYSWLLERNLRWPLVALMLAVGLLLASYKTFSEVPKEMVPSQDQSRLMVRLRTAPGSSLEQTEKVTARAEEFIYTLPEVERAMFIVGGFGGDVDEVVSFISLVPVDQRQRSQKELEHLLRTKLNS